MFFREMLEESSCRVPNGAVSAVPKLLQSVIDHNPNAFGSPSKPRVIGMYNCFSVMLFAIFLLNLNSAVNSEYCVIWLCWHWQCWYYFHLMAFFSWANLHHLVSLSILYSPIMEMDLWICRNGFLVGQMSFLSLSSVSDPVIGDMLQQGDS